jgi:hypothetical protein
MQFRVAVLLIAVISCGCDGASLGQVDLSKRDPVPVDPETEIILTQWAKQREGKASLYAEFKRTRQVRDVLFQVDGKPKVRSIAQHGAIRIGGHGAGNVRLDFKADDKGWGREVWIATSEMDLWHVSGDNRTAVVYEKLMPKGGVVQLLRATLFAWLVPSDNQSLKRYGAIRKTSEDAATVVLRVENHVRSKNPDEYIAMTVTLRKADMLPVRIVLQESETAESTWEFTDIRENVEFGVKDFAIPQLPPAEWKIERVKAIPDALPAFPDLKNGVPETPVPPKASNPSEVRS